MKKEMFSFSEKKIVCLETSPQHQSSSSEVEPIKPVETPISTPVNPDTTETAEDMTFEPLNLEVSDSGINFSGNSKEFVSAIDKMISNYVPGEWAAINWQIMGSNDSEENVKKLQKVLGFSGREIDGKIGPKTLAKLKEYIQELDFEDTDSVDPNDSKSLEYGLKNFEALSRNYLNSILGNEYHQILADYQDKFQDVYNYMSGVQEFFKDLPISEFKNANVENVSKAMADKLLTAFNSLKEILPFDFTDDPGKLDFESLKKQVLSSKGPDNRFFQDINARFKDGLGKL